MIQEMYAAKLKSGAFVGFGYTEERAKKDAKHNCYDVKQCTVVKVNIEEM